ncbi:MAG: hypothetical protein EOO41_04265, partial [Methanobacteriota archaeon]
MPPLLRRTTPPLPRTALAPMSAAGAATTAPALGLTPSRAHAWQDRVGAALATLSDVASPPQSLALAASSLMSPTAHAGVKRSREALLASHVQAEASTSCAVPLLPCRPFHKADFFERLRTFAPSKWFPAAHTITPQLAAARGWRNSERGTLACVSCGATVRNVA